MTDVVKTGNEKGTTSQMYASRQSFRDDFPLTKPPAHVLPDTRVLVALLAVLAAYFMVWPIWRAGFLLEIAPNEGWNAYHADAAMGAAPLYPSTDTLIVNNYPPLSFYVVGWLSKIFGDALFVGRAVSLIAIFALGGLIAKAVTQLGGERSSAAIAGLWFVATIARPFNRFAGMNDPQLVAHAIMVTGLVWFLSRDARGRSAVPPVLLMVIAGFYKHNIIVVPVTVIIWLLVRDWRRAVAPVVAGALVATLGLALCTAIYGDVFIANLLTPRPYRIARAIGGLGRLQWVLPALALWLVWFWHDHEQKAARFTALYICVGLAAYVLQWGGEAITDNAQFDLVIATAIGFGLAFSNAGVTSFGQRYGVDRARQIMFLVVAVRLLATAHIEPALVLIDGKYRAEFFSNAMVVRAEAARIVQIPGPVACELKVVCRMAGKPFSYDDFRTEMIIATGASNGLDKLGLIHAHRLTYVRNDSRGDASILFRFIVGRDLAHRMNLK